jgi:hypothetical protein
LAATAGDAQAALSWNPAAGASSYNVKRATVNGGPYTLVATNLTTTYTNTGLSNGITYYYVVSAVNISGEGTTSSQVRVTSSSTVPVDVLMSVSDEILNLSWPADHTGWRLQVQTNGLETGLGLNWFDVVGSTATNNVALPIDANQGSLFYRLIYP